MPLPPLFYLLTIQQAVPDFDWFGLGIIMAGISLGLIGVFLASGGLLPDMAARAKKSLPDVLTGIVLLGVAAAIIAALS